jgi:hypothetical protein
MLVVCVLRIRDTGSLSSKTGYIEPLSHMFLHSFWTRPLVSNSCFVSEHVAPIFWVEDKGKQETSMKHEASKALFAICFMFLRNVD